MPPASATSVPRTQPEGKGCMDFISWTPGPPQTTASGLSPQRPPHSGGQGEGLPRRAVPPPPPRLHLHQHDRPLPFQTSLTPPKVTLSLLQQASRAARGRQEGTGCSRGTPTLQPAAEHPHTATGLAPTGMQDLPLGTARPVTPPPRSPPRTHTCTPAPRSQPGELGPPPRLDVFAAALPLHTIPAHRPRRRLFESPSPAESIYNRYCS